jgi:acetyl esterase
MKRKILCPALFVLFVTSVLVSTATAQRSRSYPPKFEGAEELIYREIGDTKLKLFVFKPSDEFTKPRPAIVFFFGGGWRSGSPAQFEPHCHALAKLGMVAITADYRVSSRHESKAIDSVADAQTAIAYVRSHAKELGVDPGKVVAAGGSAGGHLAACTAVLPAPVDKTVPTDADCHPSAAILFNPAVVLAPVEGEDFFSREKLASLKDRMGTEPRALSPYHNVHKDSPPILVLHGKADSTVPYRTAEVFAAKMKELGNRCELVGYEGQPHGFFNAGRGGNKMYDATLAESVKFLASLGYVKTTQ